MFVSDTPCPWQKYCKKYQKLAFYNKFIINIIQVFAQNHGYDFYQKYSRIFKCQIDRYERAKEYMNANHKYETKVKEN